MGGGGAYHRVTYRLIWECPFFANIIEYLDIYFFGHHYTLDDNSECPMDYELSLLPNVSS